MKPKLGKGREFRVLVVGMQDAGKTSFMMQVCVRPDLPVSAYFFTHSWSIVYRFRAAGKEDCNNVGVARHADGG